MEIHSLSNKQPLEGEYVKMSKLIKKMRIYFFVCFIEPYFLIYLEREERRTEVLVKNVADSLHYYLFSLIKLLQSLYIYRKSMILKYRKTWRTRFIHRILRFVELDVIFWRLFLDLLLDLRVRELIICKKQILLFRVDFLLHLIV